MSACRAHEASTLPALLLVVIAKAIALEALRLAWLGLKVACTNRGVAQTDTQKSHLKDDLQGTRCRLCG